MIYDQLFTSTASNNTIVKLVQLINSLFLKGISSDYIWKYSVIEVDNNLRNY